MAEALMNLKHWNKVAKRRPRDTWLLRAELASYLIRSNDVVCDLGAGSQKIRSLLPESVEYIPVDCVKEHENTFVTDLNKDFTLPDRPFNVILCLGLLPYLNDLQKFFRNLVAQQPGKFILFSYGFAKDGDANRRVRNEMESIEQGMEFFSRYVANLTLVAQIHKSHPRFLFSGTLGTSGDNQSPIAKRSLSELVNVNNNITHGQYRLAPIARRLRLFR